MSRISSRIVALDVLRGLALFGMFAYHGTFDLAFFGLIAPTIPFLWPMRIYAHTVACLFLALVGVSMALAYDGRFDLNKFARRVALLVCACALVSVGTYVFAPQEWIFFGVLHCIAASTLLCAAVLPWRPRVGFVLGVALIAAPWLFAAAGIDVPWPMWLGLSAEEPVTLDWRPLLPWSGVAVLAMSGARSEVGKPRLRSLASLDASSPPARGLAFFGRHSLAIYLVHQPIFFGALFALVMAMNALRG
jgi:uncharacterized membrane protein